MLLELSANSVGRAASKRKMRLPENRQKRNKHFIHLSKETRLSFCCLLLLFNVVASCVRRDGDSKSVISNIELAEIARNESLAPVHPGIPGQQPFWNINSKRFIYAPAFDFEELPGEKTYQFTIRSKANNQTVIFEAPKPWAPLTPVWNQLPPGVFHLTVEAIDLESKFPIGIIGERDFLKSTPFSGVRNKPAISYKESGYHNLRDLLHQPKVQYWLKHGRPDPEYPLWSHPTKIMSALVIGMIHFAMYFPDTEDADTASKIAFLTSDFLLSMIEPKGKPLEYWPPTYWDGVPRGEHPYFENEIMTNSPAIGAEMLLDLYDFTKDEKYFNAAIRIAGTYMKTQRTDGTWAQILNTETGEAVKRNKLVPTMVIELFDRFQEDYGIDDYAGAKRKAFDWCMQNPVKTFNWQSQFEDTRPQSQFKNLSREEPTEFARILFKASAEHPEYIDLAKELIRFAEDQFVVWEPTDPVLSYPWFKDDSKWNGTTLEEGYDWFIPSALEQYKFYTPIARSCQLMIIAYLQAYHYTGESIYHAKAVALANTLTIAQAYHGDGEIPTHLRKNLPELNWINNGVYPAITLIEYANQLSNNSISKE